MKSEVKKAGKGRRVRVTNRLVGWDGVIDWEGDDVDLIGEYSRAASEKRGRVWCIMMPHVQYTYRGRQRGRGEEGERGICITVQD